MKNKITINQNKLKDILEGFVKNPNWIPGFIAGEACFTAYQNKQKTGRYPYQIQPAFIVVQHKRDIEILYRLQHHFGCGQVNKNKGKNDETSEVWQWRVRDVTHQCNIIIPFFEKHRILTTKEKEFILFKELASLMKSKYHLESTRNYEHCLMLAKSIPELRKESKRLSHLPIIGEE